jgi:hypothetical protein
MPLKQLKMAIRTPTLSTHPRLLKYIFVKSSELNGNTQYLTGTNMFHSVRMYVFLCSISHKFSDMKQSAYLAIHNLCALDISNTLITKLIVYLLSLFSSLLV